MVSAYVCWSGFTYRQIEWSDGCPEASRVLVDACGLGELAQEGMAPYMRGYIHLLSLGQMRMHDTSGPEPCLRDRSQVRSRVHAFLLSVSCHDTVSSDAHRGAELDQDPVRAVHIGDD